MTARTPEDRALSVLRIIASEDVVEAAVRAVERGSHVWVEDPVFDAVALVVPGTHEAVIAVYFGTVSSDRADFEVNDEFLEAHIRSVEPYRR